jgi:hypothetical protein
MIAFQPDTDNRTTRVRVVVPAPVREALEHTYANDCVGVLPYEEKTDADELVRLCRIYAQRRGLKLHVEYATTDDGQNVLRLKMRKKRTYTKRSTHWQHRATA